MSRDALLSDLRVLVVDLQATGAAPDKGSIVELGWAFTAADGVLRDAEAHWVELPEDATVPTIVRRLLGLPSLSAAGPGASEGALSQPAVLARLEAALAGGAAGPTPTVIHFARYELSFLRDLFARLSSSGAEPPLDAVCLHELARRLLPDLPRRSLRALAGYLGDSAPTAHRAAAHVAASAYVYSRLLPELAGRGVDTWAALKAFTSDTPAPRSRRINPLPRSFARTLPAGPGVYRFRRSNGDVLYVGKATSLRERVASHLTRSKKLPERALEMLTQARDVEVTETCTALEAALLECDEIKRLDPPYNVLLKRSRVRGALALPAPSGERGVWFCAPRLDAAAPAPTAAGYLGPFPSASAVLCLGAIARYLARDPDPRLPAECLGVPQPWAPEAGLFETAFRELVADVLSAHRCRTPRGTVLRAGHALLLGGFRPDDAADDDEPVGWDVPRVRRHLERALWRGVQLVRRARCLVLFGDARVEYRDGTDSSASVALIAGEQVDPLAWRPPAWTPWLARQARFDAQRYDRVRVLLSELKRLLGDPRSAIVEVRLAPARRDGPAPRLGQVAVARLLAAT